MVGFFEAIGDFEMAISGGFAVYALMCMLFVAVAGVHTLITGIVKYLP